MPTTRGWALLGGGLALVVLWWAFGDAELLLAGVFMVIAIALAVLVVRLRPPRLRTNRRLGPSALHSGETAMVTLVIENEGRAAQRNIVVSDQVEEMGRATFEIARLPPREAAAARYRVTCQPRGVYTVGPISLTVGDPLGLAEISGLVGPEDRLVVYPRVEDLTGFPVGRGQDPAMSASKPEHAQRGGEDFYTLREYQRGDDMRRVHWPSSAKTDKLMIRQLETPWQSRALVLLDVRRHVYESIEAFETAVSGAASVITHLVSAGFAADLWAGDARTIDASRYAAAMEKLAVVQPSGGVDLGAVAGRIRQKGGGGTLAIVTGNADREVLSVHQMLANNYPTTVLLGASSTTPQTLAGFHRFGVPTVSVAPGEDWAEAWMIAMRSSWTVVSAG
jgi:uncharacterized protein (DUF58 family)